VNDTPARPPHLGLHHLALTVGDLAEARRFYVDLLGFRVEWEPDAENLYLTSGSDNLALHKRREGEPAEPQRLDHLGICCHDPATVDRWHRWLAANTVRILSAPRRHRDGAYSFYCLDHDGVRVQFIHHPPITSALVRAQGS
jgi:catechol 2,3-dioxygenase-like lactoylglutathione lyase family enzyme